MMNICNCKNRFKKNGVHDESICYTLCDLFCNLRCNYQWTMVLLSLLLTSCIILIPNKSVCLFSKLSELYLSVFPSTLGLSIATYAIVVGFQSNVLKNLQEEDEKNVRPFHVICASMIFNGLMQILTIILSFVFQLISTPLLFYISTFLGCLSLLQTFDILLQLLGLRTFVSHSDKSQKQ